MSKIDAKKTVVIKDGIYSLPSDTEEGHLIGCRCKDCDNIFFPDRKNCLVCYSENIESVPLSNKGKVFRYTIVRQNYPGSALTPPYIAAQIKLPESVFVTTLVTGIAFEDIRIGMEMEAHFDTVIDENDERKVVVFDFRPVSS